MLRPITVLALLAVPVASAAQTSPATEEAKPVSRSELTTELDSDYADLDANSDGKVDSDEIKARLKRTSQAQLDELVKQRDAAFVRLDTDGDGSISRAEFDAQAKLPSLPDPDAQPFLAQFDADKDGTISQEEFRAPTLSNFDRMDGDKDGTLTVDEQKLPPPRSRAKPQETPPIGR